MTKDANACVAASKSEIEYLKAIRARFAPTDGYYPSDGARAVVRLCNRLLAYRRKGGFAIAKQEPLQVQMDRLYDLKTEVTEIFGRQDDELHRLYTLAGVKFSQLCRRLGNNVPVRFQTRPARLHGATTAAAAQAKPCFTGTSPALGAHDVWRSLDIHGTSLAV